MDGLKRLFDNRNIKNEDLLHIKCKRYGQANRDKTLYFIEEDNKDLGFFAMYRAWLEYLYFADVCGYVPVVEAGENFAYKEKKLIHGKMNPFEYYFNQPGIVSVQEAKYSARVIHSNLFHRQMVELIFTGKYNNYKCNKRYLIEMAHIAKKYIRFNQMTLDYIFKGIQQLGDKTDKMLGVHVRGTDFRAKYDNHPVYLTEQDCFEEINRIWDENTYDRIFLATDDKRVLEKFINQYGKRVCFYENVKRNSRNQSVAFSSDSRKNHKYLLGLEVIRDMYTLSMCSGLIAGISQVAICAQISKLSRGEHYENLKVIDKGLNINNHKFNRRYYKEQ